MAMVHSGSVLITGCGQGGIGHALALEFKHNGVSMLSGKKIGHTNFKKGYTVFATLLPHEPRDHLTDAGIHAYSADVTVDGEIHDLRESITAITQGRLDVLVNCAGICYTMTAADTDVKEVEKMFAVNVFGPMRMVHIFHPLLIRARGKIVNIGSVGGIVPYVYGSSYNASKAALHHWGDTLRVEMKPLGVCVINIISGEVSTNILKRDHGRTLPEDSFYRPLEKQFSSHVTRTPHTTTPQVYARAVVGEVMKRRPRAWFWTGAISSFVRYCDMFLPRTFWDWMFTRDFNLDVLRIR
ncbi:short chain dehydrogenase [Xylariaceae sp. AK1471]|nr:short chain dehydrogenase [Xylariaceae sp. AK1471]